MKQIIKTINKERDMIFVHAGKMQLAIWAEIRESNNAALYTNKHNKLDELYMLRNKITDLMYSLDNLGLE